MSLRKCLPKKLNSHCLNFLKKLELVNVQIDSWLGRCKSSTISCGLIGLCSFLPSVFFYNIYSILCPVSFNNLQDFEVLVLPRSVSILRQALLHSWFFCGIICYSHLSSSIYYLQYSSFFMRSFFYWNVSDLQFSFL